MTHKPDASAKKDAAASQRPAVVNPSAESSATVTATAEQPEPAGEAHDAAASAAPGSVRPSAGSAAIANEIIAGTAAHGIDHYMRGLQDPKESVATHAARVIEELVQQKPELAAPYIERLCALLLSEHPRVAQCAANVLPALARVAPAKVAKHLKTLQGSFAQGSDVAKDGLVRTFVSLCQASVIYQKRLIDIFEEALRHADPKTLSRWVEIILPALKGEPYAQARAVAEKRIADPELARPIAQRVADLLGVKLRIAAR